MMARGANPKDMSDQKTIMRDMLANAVHFGHKSSKWNPKMAPFLFTKRNGVHVFDLNKTYEGLNKATDFLKEAVKQGQTVLFVSTKQQAMTLIREEAEKCGMPYVTSKWIPGLLTNFKTIRARVRHMQKLKADRESGEFEKYTKKEALKFDKEIQKLENALGGVESLDKLPKIVFILDLVRDRIAAQEAKKIGATVVAVADSNSDPEGVDYVIPGNDDAIKSIHYLVSAVSTAIQDGKKSK
jgi:small subunit ribosomal protein S2